MVIFGILLRENAELKEQLWQAGSDIEATDDYWASQMGDYQLDIYMDSAWLRDYANDTTIYRCSVDSLGLLTEAILLDNQ